MTRIAICAPSAPIAREDAARVLALAAAEFPQLSLHFHEQCFTEEGHFAGADRVRYAALLDCANDANVDAVWLARGGYGAGRIAETAIAGMAAAARDKAFLGYSDAGYLLGGLYRAGIGRVAHGPMVRDITRENGDDAVRRALGYLAGARDGIEAGIDERPVAAFNLMTLAMLCGTELMPDLRGHVVLVEEVSEHLYAVDRLFFHVSSHLAGHLAGIAGLRLGRVSEVPENDRPFGASSEDIARDWCARRGIVFLGAADIGHDAANKIVPFGVVERV